MNATARQTAMVLAGLPPAERDWVLKHLPAARGRALAALVDEAVSLGIRIDGVMLGRVMDALDRRASPEDAKAYVELAKPQALCAVLSEAPAALIARLLVAHPWRWREAFIARFSGPQKRDALAALREMTARDAPRLSEAIIAEVADLLRAQPHRIAPIAPPNSWSRISALVKAFPLTRRGHK
jgi:hypothetical protein